MKQFLLLIILLAANNIVVSQNLITNPSCELDPTSNGWTQVSGAWIRDDYVAAQDGTYFFCGGVANGTVELYQDVDVSANAAEIDAGRYSFSFSGWIKSLGGSDQARIIVEYRNASSTVLATYNTGFQNHTSWLEYTDSRTAPVNTRTIRIRLFTQRNNGSYSDGYTDNLSLSGYVDTDGDGIADNIDIDDDNDGITDAIEAGVKCTTTEVYCGGNNGNMYKVDFNAGSVTLMTTSTQTAGYINALASNPDDGVVYYGAGTIMYVYNPNDGSHAVIPQET